MPAKLKLYTITAGQYKGKQCSIVSKKKTKSTGDNIEVNIVEGPIITIHKMFLR